MEISLSSTTSKAHGACPLPEPLLLKSAKPRERNPCSLCIARPKTFVQLSFGHTGFQSRHGAQFKVLSSQKGDVHVVESSRIDEVYNALAERLLPPGAAGANPNFKHFVGLAGPPGAGKSTLAYEVARRVNKTWSEKASSFDSEVKPPDVAIVLPMDGFHLYRYELDAMENSEEAHARRGAPWTFNPSRLLTCLTTLRNQGSVYAPSFDHGVGDPVEDDIFVNLQHKVVIIEGKPADIAKQRIDYNDRPNAELIMKCKKNADIIIKSVDF